MAIDDVGVLNDKWGICGFTSSLYAVYMNDSSRAAETADFKKPEKVLGEILKYLKAIAGQATLRSDIEKFTKSFPNFGAFDLGSYQTRLEAAVANPATIGVQDFSVAMPPHVVVDLLQRTCGFPHASLVDTGGDALPEKIIGVSRNIADQSQYKGLRHYFYYKQGTYYSWGQQFGALADVTRHHIVPYDSTSYYIKLKL